VDIRENIDDVRDALDALIDHRQAQMWTALPVRFEEWDSEKNTAKVQPLIKVTRRKDDGSQERVELPQLEDAPVHFMSGGGATMTFPIKKGDTGLAIFSSRSIDQWHQSGNVEQQISARMHDLSDGWIIPGGHALPKVPKNISKDSTQMRVDNDKGEPVHFVDYHEKNGITTSVGEGKHITIHHPENGISHKSSVRVHVEAPRLSMKGPLKVTGQIQSTIGLKAPLYEAEPGVVPDADA
jgi:hypothetical protein